MMYACVHACMRVYVYACMRVSIDAYMCMDAYMLRVCRRARMHADADMMCAYAQHARILVTPSVYRVLSNLTPHAIESHPPSPPPSQHSRRRHTRGRGGGGPSG
eukprot:Tamp_39559.p2 GENE.Tamp_39559~~Tamp_39559.p2  ORF type:complete len:104 (+),score=2.20 Tamp_39559:25-336(+)